MTLLSSPIEADEGPTISVLFDVRDPREHETLRKLQGVFQQRGRLEAVTEDLFALHIRPGAALDLLR